MGCRFSWEVPLRPSIPMRSAHGAPPRSFTRQLISRWQASSRANASLLAWMIPVAHAKTWQILANGANRFHGWIAVFPVERKRGRRIEQRGHPGAIVHRPATLPEQIGDIRPGLRVGEAEVDRLADKGWARAGRLTDEDRL